MSASQSPVDYRETRQENGVYRVLDADYGDEPEDDRGGLLGSFFDYGQSVLEGGLFTGKMLVGGALAGLGYLTMENQMGGKASRALEGAALLGGGALLYKTLDDQYDVRGRAEAVKDTWNAMPEDERENGMDAINDFLDGVESEVTPSNIFNQALQVNEEYGGALFEFPRNMFDGYQSKYAS